MAVCRSYLIDIRSDFVKEINKEIQIPPSFFCVFLKTSYPPHYLSSYPFVYLVQHIWQSSFVKLVSEDSLWCEFIQTFCNRKFLCFSYVQKTLNSSCLSVLLLYLHLCCSILRYSSVYILPKWSIDFDWSKNEYYI